MMVRPERRGEGGGAHRRWVPCGRRRGRGTVAEWPRRPVMTEERFDEDALAEDPLDAEKRR